MRKLALAFAIFWIGAGVLAYANPPATFSNLLISCGLPVTVTVDANATTDTLGNGVTTLSNSNLTVTASGNALVTQISIDNQTFTGLTCNWDSAGTPQALTLIKSQVSASTNGTVLLYGLVNPRIGNKTLTCSWTGTSGIHLNVTSFRNVNQTGGSVSFPNAIGANGNGTTASTGSITAGSNDLTISSIGAGNNTSGGATQTVLYNNQATLLFTGNAQRGTAAGSATHSVTVSPGAANWAAAGSAIRSSCPVS